MNEPLKARFPSLELNWLPMSLRKGLSTPRIFYYTKFSCGGYYVRRTFHRCLHIELDVDLKEGAVLVIAHPDEERQHTLVHEWRHHWQIENGIDKPPWPWQDSVGFSTSRYEDAIRAYFKEPTELDALLFQHKQEPDDLSDYWMSLVMA